MAGDDGGRDSALSQLPDAYSLALRLHRAGLPGALIAECLGIEPETVSPLLLIAEAKLAALLSDAES